MDEKKFEEALKEHNDSILQMILVSNKSRMVKIGKLGEELALVYADFKCERCGSAGNIQIHHLICLKNRSFMDYWKFMSQRIHMGNLVVLCENCHRSIEGFSKSKPKFMGCISGKKLDGIRRKYGC